MGHRRSVGRAWVLAITVGAVVGASAPGSAAVSGPTGVDIESILDDVQPAVLRDVVDVEPARAGADVLAVETEGGDVTVPRDPENAIELTPPEGDALAVSLPFAAAAADADAVADGIVSYDNGNGSHTAPVVKEDGSVQIATVISDAGAPERYPYEVHLPPDATVEKVEGGGVVFRSAGGEFLGGLTPPWAKDSNGTAVPTRYETTGTTVTQVVDHHAEGVAYPVVADPWIGADLFGYTGYNRKGTYLGQVVVSAELSAWGWYWYGTGGGPAIIMTAGWDELVSKRAQADDKATLKQQFDCHVTFGYAVWLAGTHWDLEKARANKSDWLSSALSHHCNW